MAGENGVGKREGLTKADSGTGPRLPCARGDGPGDGSGPEFHELPPRN